MAFQRFDRAELRFSLYLNRSSDIVAVCSFFRTVSKLGDGWIWYALMLCLPGLYGWDGAKAAVHMGVTAGVGVLAYKLIKARTVRARPFVTHASIHCATAPLDQYSFPSGHTMHAVSFTSITAYYFPEWLPVLAVVSLLIALSRVVLGLHYPSDVLAGGVLGGVLAGVSLWLFG